MYQVVAGQALQSLCVALGGSCLRLTWWILVFSAAVAVLCLLPDINRWRGCSWVWRRAAAPLLRWLKPARQLRPLSLTLAWLPRVAVWRP